MRGWRVILAAMEEGSVTALADDGELARRIAAGPAARALEAEAQLYRRFAPRVRLYGLRHLRNEQAAADLMQQVMITTIEQLRAGKLREADRIGSFVFGICRMTVVELRRGTARRKRLLTTYGADLVPIVEVEVPRLDDRKVAKCLETLSERERSVLVMTFFEDRPAGDVAMALGLSAGNVRVIRHRGLERLRDCVTGGEGPR